MLASPPSRGPPDELPARSGPRLSASPGGGRSGADSRRLGCPQVTSWPPLRGALLRLRLLRHSRAGLATPSRVTRLRGLSVDPAHRRQQNSRVQNELGERSAALRASSPFGATVLLARSRGRRPLRPLTPESLHTQPMQSEGSPPRGKAPRGCLQRLDFTRPAASADSCVSAFHSVGRTPTGSDAPA